MKEFAGHAARNLKTTLFVPADKPKYLASAIELKPDAVQLDLEDSIAPENKADARQQLGNAAQQLSEAGIPTIVRINSDDGLTEDDIRAAVEAQVNAITIPKLESRTQLQQVESMLTHYEAKSDTSTTGQTRIFGLIETVAGLMNREGWRDASDRLAGLTLGTEDLSHDIGCAPTHDNLLEPCRRVLYAAREAKLAAWGFPNSIGNFSNLDELQAAFAAAKSMGMDGVWCIHPAQVKLARAVFTITDQELAHATKVVIQFEAAMQQGQAVIQIDGQMIDLPVYQRALALVQT